MSGHSERARLALAHLSEVDPSLAALSLWCEHRDSDLSTRTEGETILYGPEFPMRPLPEQVGLAGHHILHVALRHAARMAELEARIGADFDGALYNLAADAVVNEGMHRAGHALPQAAVRLSDFVDDGEQLLAEWDADRLYIHLQRGGGSRGQASAEPSERDLFVGDAQSDGDARAAGWRGHLARALQIGRQAGRGIGRFAPGFGDLPLSRVPWEVRLRGLVARAVSDVPRRSYRRPASSWIAMEANARTAGGPAPVFQPGLARDRRRLRIAVGLDASSSIDDRTFERFAGEIVGIARRTGAEVHVLAFDEFVHHVERVDTGQPESVLRNLPVRRGGGTSFVDVIDRADRLEASVAVILTDLDGDFGPPAAVPVVWATPVHVVVEPPFGSVISLDC
jgi:hypothetical protein